MTSCQKKGYIYPLAHHKRQEEKGTKGDSAIAWHNVVIVKIDFKMQGLVRVSAVGAAASTDFEKYWFCTQIFWGKLILNS